MTTTVFVAGSMNIKNLDSTVKDRIDKIVASDFEIVVGDADGADSSIQAHLFEKGASRTTVYCSGSKPRNNIGGWPFRVVENSIPKAHAPSSLPKIWRWRMLPTMD
jgi:hypothetical protein